jgi:hypothetical protein
MVLLSLASRQIWPQVLAVLHAQPQRLVLFHSDEEGETQPGFDLEYATAFALLKLGVPVVQRSVRLAPRVVRGSGREEGELGGLLGQAICVRRSVMPIQAQEFAQSRRIPVVLKDRLMSGLRSLLYPNEPASLEQLHELAKARTAGRA